MNPDFNVVYSRDNLTDKIKYGTLCNKSQSICWYCHWLDCFVCVE